MKKVHDVGAPTSALEAAAPAIALFNIGTPVQASSTKNLRQSTSFGTLAHSKSLQSKPTESNKPKSRPIVYGTARSKAKDIKKPITQSLPLAFPANSNFTFNLANADANRATTGMNAARAIHILPTDVLILVARFIEPNRHHRVLKVLSLVSRVLNVAIAPILYRRLRLFHLKEAYDFALHFRHPTSVVSLEMFLTPDPLDAKWLPPNADWVGRLADKLNEMEGLVSLNVKRCKDDTILETIARHSNNPSFLPALQRVSLGSWHNFTRFATAGRSLACYGLTFDIHNPSDYENMDQQLATLNLSSKLVLELKLTVNFTDRFQVHVGSSGDYREKIIRSAVCHFPRLQTLVLRFQHRNDSGIRQYKPEPTDILTLIPHKMTSLSHLDLFDLRSSEYRAEAIVQVANELSAEEGLCPRLKFLGLDGLLWKRTPDSLSPQQIATELSCLVLNEQKRNVPLKDCCNQASPDIPLLKVSWTPSPSNPRGLKWWANRAQELFPPSRQKALLLLREWMLHYWDPAHVPADDSVLDRAVPRW
ncbi:hypothetical protein RSOLAG1IB_07777 [Rhizoctonia solani AG-1 IB]|uniref:F-box domain-containing protein n=1 Tax=Thanatephorus cucumeris (strain AG1-IB / isolate 7/3/14) TaxID=1108050 RepID=A0A0B7FEC1_THACB|nr:hypothetical protein RSOLAG1IB_07777 [Rhizoctonia solani AG-1 IB]